MWVSLPGRAGPEDLGALGVMLLDPAAHGSALARLAAAALIKGRTLEAFALADRRCRLPQPAGARDVLLRAEALRRLGDLDGAAADIARAAEIDPTDPLLPTPSGAKIPSPAVRQAPRERPRLRTRPVGSGLHAAASAVASAVDLTVIVPVFEDFERTVACLDSLDGQELSGTRWRVIVVDDASPNRRIRADIAARARAGRLDVVEMVENEGFAAAVNAAARLAPTGDLLLLNADTWLPPGALRRLLAVAAAEPDVGTVTPLSNNGEEASFPRLHAATDLPDEPELVAWDQAAERAGGRPVDLVNGIGFCLLVTRRCWDAVGGLTRRYGRGYYEDVELCLKARERGLRNLCATHVVVGHAGSRSFGAAKRALVVRNFALLTARYPDYEAETAAFAQAEPLRGACAAIERELSPRPHEILLATGRALDHPALRSRVAALQPQGRVLILSAAPGSDGTVVSLRSAAGSVPQSLRFRLGRDGEREALLAYLRGVRLADVEVDEPGTCPGDLLSVLRDCALRSKAPSSPARGERAALPRERTPRHPPWDSDRAPSPILGLLSPLATAEVTSLAHAIGARLRAAGSSWLLLVMGTTRDDLALIGGGSCFVTGALAAGEVAWVARSYGVSRLILPYRDAALAWHDEASGAAIGARAYFRPPSALAAVQPGDLALDPELDDGTAAERVVAWAGAIGR